MQTVCEAACISELHFESTTSELGIFFWFNLTNSFVVMMRKWLWQIGWQIRWPKYHHWVGLASESLCFPQNVTVPTTEVIVTPLCQLFSVWLASFHSEGKLIPQPLGMASWRLWPVGYGRNDITSLPGMACQDHDTFAYGPLEHWLFPLALYLIAICGRPKLHGEATHIEFTGQLTACVDCQPS